jgi:hypothetical protein
VIDDHGELDAHAVRILEPQAVKGAEVLDRAFGGAPLHEPLPQDGEGLR